MDIDIIGSSLANRLTEFRNFPYNINVAVTGQSFLSLLTKPYPVDMKHINTTDITEISTAHRDLNKTHYEALKSSHAEVLMIDLLSELSDLVVYDNSYFNARSFDLIDDHIDYTPVSKIEQFRQLKNHLDHIINVTKHYEQVILIDALPNNSHDDFIQGLFDLLVDKIENKLILTVKNDSVADIFNAPLEVYDQIIIQLRKFNSDNYDNQLLFDEKLENDTISVYMNYLGQRDYLYELYKDGQAFKKSHQTSSRYSQFKLTEPGKYRIRVTAVDTDVNPRFSETYNYTGMTPSLESLNFDYIEMPDSQKEWMLKLIIQAVDIKGIVGNPYKYIDGYDNYPVYSKEEIEAPYIKTDQLFDIVTTIVSEINRLELDNFLEANKLSLQKATPAMRQYIEYLQTQK